MTTLADNARSLIAYTVWADNRLLKAADGIDQAQFGQLTDQLHHMLGTQLYWYANWHGTEFVEPAFASLPAAREAYAASHAALRAYGDALTDDGWHREEQWWLRWGYENRLAVGESITQLFYHGTQHRSEMSVLLSIWGHSPGDMDYLTYLQEAVGQVVP
jgi:uncharacterized damage-inducible protein DinB